MRLKHAYVYWVMWDWSFLLTNKNVWSSSKVHTSFIVRVRLFGSICLCCSTNYEQSSFIAFFVIVYAWCAVLVFFVSLPSFLVIELGFWLYCQGHEMCHGIWRMRICLTANWSFGTCGRTKPNNQSNHMKRRHAL